MYNDSRKPDDKALIRRPDESIATPAGRPGTQRAVARAEAGDPEAEYNAFRDALTEFAAPQAKEPRPQVAHSTTERQMAPTIVRLGSAALLLAFALAGFLKLPLYVAILWLVFLIVAFPIGLAYMSHSDALERNDLLTLYRTGVQQLPVIGRLLGSVLPGVKKND